MLGISIINRNNFNLTFNVIKDLLNQDDKNFELTIFDNGSNEDIQKIRSLDKYDHIKKIIFNKKNIPLCHLWNKFYLNTDYELLCFLNNDVRIPNNFISDNNKIFKENSNAGVVVHSTNHPKFQETTDLKYKVVYKKYMQGWDFTIRRKAYTCIPSQIHFFCGDDYLYTNLYKNKWNMIYALSSPIIHYCAKTPRIEGISNRDIAEYEKLGYHHGKMKINKKYSRLKPNLNLLKNHIALQ